MPQVKIGLSDRQRSALEKAAKAAGRTFSEECRIRLSKSIFEDDAMGDFARVCGHEVSIIAQIVQLSSFEKDTKVADLSAEQLSKYQSTMWRAMVVAVNDYFSEIKPKHFGPQLTPPPTEPNVRADAIGHAAAQGLFVWASGQAGSPYPEVDWMFKHRPKPQEEKP
jgi:hypothetical protein